MISKGHRIEEVPELLLVLEDKFEGYKKTKEAVQLLKKLKAWNDIKKVGSPYTLRSNGWMGRLQFLLSIDYRKFKDPKIVVVGLIRDSIGNLSLVYMCLCTCKYLFVYILKDSMEESQFCCHFFFLAVML